VRSKFDPTLKIALTANLFEWYEFSLTAFMALEIGRLFFPPASDQTALALSFLIFATSYLARPVGSVCFGLLGNRFGVGAALRLSMLGMAIPASLVALLPTYRTAGYAATLLLLILKLLQGFCAGGEMPLSGYFVSLNASARNRGLYCALVVVSGFIGMLLASGTLFLLPRFAGLLPAQPEGVLGRFVAETWRWPFLLCIPISAGVYALRASIKTGASEAAHARPARHDRPLGPLLQAFVLVAFMEIVIYTVFVWMPGYLHTYLGVPTADARASNVITLLAFSVAMVGAGWSARFIPASGLVLGGVVSTVLFSYPLFDLLRSGVYASILLAQLGFAVTAGCIVGVIFVILPDLFRHNWGSFGMASTYSLATALFGGTAPLVCAYLIDVTHLTSAPALYIVATGVLAMPVAYRMYAATRREARLGLSV
jgi:MFS transporter, MHS family, proline/betaine transporter